MSLGSPALAVGFFTSSITEKPNNIIENPKEVTRKLLELTNEFSKVTVYKINMDKFLEFLYTYNKRSEREIKETFPFKIATK